MSIVWTFYRRQLNLKIIPFDHIYANHQKIKMDFQISVLIGMAHTRPAAAPAPYLTGKKLI